MSGQAMLVYKAYQCEAPWTEIAEEASSGKEKKKGHV